MRDRQCFVIIDGKEIPIEFGYLVVGDVFKLVEDGITVTTETGKSTFVAMSYPYRSCTGAWTIDIG